MQSLKSQVKLWHFNDLEDTLASAYRRIGYDLAAIVALYYPAISDEESKRISAVWFANALTDPYYLNEVVDVVREKNLASVARLVADWERCQHCEKVVCLKEHSAYPRITRQTATLNRPDYQFVCDDCRDDIDFGQVPPAIELTKPISEPQAPAPVIRTARYHIRARAINHRFPLRRVDA